MVPHPRARFFRGSAGSHAGGSQLLLISPPDRAAVLRSRPQFISRISSAAQTLHFLRGRGGETSPRGFRVETKSIVAYAPGGDSPRNCSVVHHRNPPRRVAGTDAR